ncbi:MAG: RNA 2'-phosphotransferase [Clostridiales bacterium]|nr:RNA 2'-phosphotransferase [Clostridiales bacterium]
MQDKELKKMGKYVSMLLRHHPEEAGIIIDEHGWTDVNTLIDKVSPRYPLTEELLHQMAFGPDKQRYEFSNDGKKVRAVHGHSIQVDLGYGEMEPPACLYHGTAEKYRESIEKTGLEKRNRQYVHLSERIDQAKDVGRRHGKLVLYRIDAEKMYQEGYVFYRSTSGVWLTDAVPFEYMEDIQVK